MYGYYRLQIRTFLSDSKNKPLKFQSVHASLSNLLKKIGLLASHYNTYSLQIGAATVAKYTRTLDTRIAPDAVEFHIPVT